jgi:hypothetical protein
MFEPIRARYKSDENGCRIKTMQKNLSLALILVLAFGAVVLTGCSSQEDTGANVVSVEPPKDAPLKPQSMGGSASAGSGKASEGSGQLPPP